MASLPFSALSLFFSLCVLLVLPTHSLTCSTSQKFTNNKHYTNCTALPALKSYLHYTYNSSNSSLSVAFIASPAKPDGWTGWGINLNGTGMAGAQVILALKSSKGAPEVKTYNIISYGDIREERLSFDVWDLSAETNATSGEFTIYASVKLPEKVESFNHIWQVGAAVNNGKPVKHEFAAENKDAKATLELTTAQKTGKSATTTTPAGGNSTGNGTTSSSNTTTNGGNSGSYRIKEMNVGFCFAVFVLLASFIVF
ncbi:hypothetical protein POPTR_002G249200v4 [Populus trichocarpa]|jgi:hypothetical protein|uniref:DOMON domain-containing protein n=2 Tax=Populus trichocarpa TaxID=3694 RepID=B9GQP6_POPTR|nr:auxin-induced in root cultures protein 12 [Populus trichocarpa]KAI5599867.1 hypothetical protein BDE02_02G224000 [Populus trichocarpa]PNT51565.1 hypothetical protein POPTR_002G249200v4 [Populus trichocarpa]|eukprot:XP_002301813.1 auxin-induced in root cultures protein 12 [Populus trichocarpa]